ncbi:MAG: hypothetical protein JJU00_08095 [Opitutales bacterium]|nr:hypothetical protein [Opitutales bacterium]
MTRFTTLFALASVTASASLYASDWAASIEPFLSPGVYQFTDADLGFRFTELEAAVDPAQNQSTHMLIEGLSPATGTADIYAGNYTAINLADGAVQDVGVFYVTLSGDVGDDAPPLSSPIVGVVPREGPWSDFSPEAPAQTTVGNATGTATAANGTLDFEIARDGQTGSASVPFSMPDDDTMVLEAFALSLGGTSYNFAAATLVRSGERFHGTIESLDTVDHDSLMFALFLTVADPAGVDLVDGEWITDSRLGLLFGAGGDWAYSPFMGWIETGAFPWLYQAKIGWMAYARGGQEQALWFLAGDPALGWIYVSTARDGTYQSSADDWASGSFF